MKKYTLIPVLIVLAIIIAGIYKFNFTNDDIYITNEAGEIVQIDEVATESKETIYFDETDQTWKDDYGVCNTCTFENGFNPHGWLLSDDEVVFVPQVLKAQREYDVSLSWNRITSQDQLDRLLAEVVAEYEQN